MKPAFEDMNLQIPAATAEPQDYTGEDGLLYCGKCRTPKEAYFPADKVALFGRDRHPAECDCQREKRMEREAAEQRRKHLDIVEDLKRRGFTDPEMRNWTFANDSGKCPQLPMARKYVERWEEMQAENGGLLLWGKRITELSAIFKRLYEDSVAGRISDDRFMELSADYEAEQSQLKERIAELQGELSKAQEASVNAEKFMNIVRSHTNFEELTPTLLREFIEKIVVHECSYDENKTRRQDIEIYYSFVGKVDL